MQFVKKFAAAATFGLASIGAHAALAQIQMSGIDLNYTQATGQLCDSGGGNGCFGTSDSIDAMVFRLNNVVLGTYTSNVQSNIFLQLQPGTDPLGNGPITLLNSFFDIFDAEINTAPGLLTDVTTGSVTFSSNGTINVSGNGAATVFSENLPFGLDPDGPISWSFTAEQGSCTGSAGQRVCTFSGTGELSWEQQVASVPEPSTLALIGLGLLGAGAASRRRKA